MNRPTSPGAIREEVLAALGGRTEGHPNLRLQAYGLLSLGRGMSRPWSNGTSTGDPGPCLGGESRPERYESYLATRSSFFTPHATTFLALDGDETVGLVRTFVALDDAASAELVSMWVASQVRGQGVGRQLMAAVIEWVRQHDATSVQLWVTETNSPARRLYESFGFVRSDERQPLPSNPSLSEVAMRLVFDD